MHTNVRRIAPQHQLHALLALQVVVRKMACHSGLAFGKDKAADRGAKSSKKRKTPGAAAKRPAAAAAAAKSKKARRA